MGLVLVGAQWMSKTERSCGSPVWWKSCCGAGVLSLAPRAIATGSCQALDVTMWLRNGLYSCQITCVAIRLSSTDLPASEPTCLTSAGIATGPWGIGWRYADVEMSILRACPVPECRSSSRSSLNKLGHRFGIGISRCWMQHFLKLSFIWWLIFDKMDKEQQWQTNKDLAITWLWNYRKDTRHDLKLRTSGWELVQPWLVVRDKACAS